MNEIDEETKIWAKEHFDTMSVGGVWSPEGTGLTYQKTADNAWLLIRKMNHPSVTESHAAIATLMQSIDIDMIEGAEEIYNPPQNPEEAYMMETEHKQMIANTWKCECGKLIHEINLELSKPTFVSEQEILLDNGETDMIEVWVYSLDCPDCDANINIDPDDYHLLTDDRLFMRYKNNEGTIMQALTRREMMIMEATGELGALVGTVDPHTGEKVPPWLWGTYCSIGSEEEVKINLEEEE